MADTTRRQAQEVVSINPRSTNSPVHASYFRQLENSRSDFLLDKEEVSDHSIAEFFRTLSPLFEVARLAWSIKQHKANIAAAAKRAYTSKTRRLKAGPTVLGRKTHKADDVNAEFLIQYQLRRPDFAGPVSMTDVRSDIDSIFETGFSRHQHQVQKMLADDEGWPRIPVSCPPLISFTRALQPTQRYALMSEFLESRTEIGWAHKSDMLRLRIRDWLSGQSFKACEHLYNLDQQLRQVTHHALQLLASHHGAASIPMVTLHGLPFDTPLAVAIAFAAQRPTGGVHGKFRIDEDDRDYISNKVAVYYCIRNSKAAYDREWTLSVYRFIFG